jgi:transcriptional regulator GlxA family with amidase domain
VVIDFAGPWEVFSDVMLHTEDQTHEQLHPFHLYTVAETAKPIRTSGGMQVVPDYTFENAPKANIAHQRSHGCISALAAAKAFPDPIPALQRSRIVSAQSKGQGGD